ncbi:hypothetical protein [Streptomyces sp. Ac-502]|uniref:hypothetical protein n=1 Tax=Streptomyces sp. Ac-502 TaxID=3342801 RepID=UPI003862347D
MKATSRLLAAGAAAAAAVLLAGTGATAAGQPDQAASSEPSGVEDFNYPQADKIFKETGLLLKRGDGHIVLADCDSAPGLVEVFARDKGKFCFRVTGKQGYLSMELDRVYAIRGNDFALRANMKVKERSVSFDVAKNTWTAVGETADPNNRDHTLLELITTK